MDAKDLLWALLAMGVGWTFIWLRIVLSASRHEDEAIVNEKAAGIRRRLFLPMVGILIGGFALSIYRSPYPFARKMQFGEPEVFVDVVAFQWGWNMSMTEIPMGKSIQFNVSALDVNHGFAIYDPDQQLLTQVQAMPGHPNELIFKFEKPGEYTARCLEYCGIFHHLMEKTFTVVA